MSKILIIVSIMVLLSGCVLRSLPIVSEEKSISSEVSTVSVSTTPLILRGTEPFWSFVQTATGTATYSIPGSSSIEERYYTTTEILVGTDIIITATPINPADLSISAQVSPGTCSDGMSDIVYPYTVSLSYGLNTYTGCGQ